MSDELNNSGETVEVSAVPYTWESALEKQLAIALVEAGLLSESHLRSIGATKTSDQSLLDAVIASGVASEEEIAGGLSRYYRLPHVRLASISIDASLFAYIPEEMARQHHCVPVRMDGSQLTLAMYNPLDFSPIHTLEFEHHLQVKVLITTRSDIFNAINTQYGLVGTLESFMKGLYEPEGEDIQPIATTYEIHDLEKVVTGESKPIVKLSNLILTDAIDARASDVHIEPLINMVKIRYRVDGVMQEHLTLPKWAQNAIASRFKVIANLDIAMRRQPQDGRLNLIYKKRTIDLRVSTLPTHYGEKIVMRILDHDRAIPALEELGLSGRNLQVIQAAFRAPQGLILTTGPTGSGKTSTLYAAILSLRTGAKNIVTVEDPIEFQIPGVNQVQVNERAKLTFASALRSILRQDPDVVMLGEIRDHETADIAFQAAQTGHLVLSSLHTNDAISTITRLGELGIEPYLIADCTLMVMAQRLARRSCQECLEPYIPDPEDLRRLGLTLDSMDYVRGTGCEACRNTGYQGRLGIFEVLALDPAITEMIIKGANTVELKSTAIKSGMKFLNDDAIFKIREGLTTTDEVLRVIFLEEEFQFRCPTCTKAIDPDFSICPFCRFELKVMCPACGIELNPDWTHCPHCRTDLNSAPAELQAPEPPKDAVTLELTADDLKRVPLTPVEEIPKAAPQPTVQPSASPQTSLVETPMTNEPIGQLPGQLNDIMVPDGTFRVMIVDDDIVTCNLITLLMRRFDFETTAVIANDGKSALEKMEDEVPHVIILDLLMPTMDGYEFLARLRQDLRTAFIPVVVITQTKKEDTERLARDYGADAYLNKPLNPQELEKCMKDLLHRIYGI